MAKQDLGSFEAMLFSYSRRERMPELIRVPAALASPLGKFLAATLS